MLPKPIMKTSPARIIICSIFFTIFLGTALLSLPWCRTVPISLLDLFFTASSVTCVTGLLTIPLTSFTPLGHVIILIMMQIGGLGLITLTIFLMLLFTDLGFGTQLIAGQLLELESWKNVKKLIIFIIGFTVFAELIGAFFIFCALRNYHDLIHKPFLSIFHAVSAFCDTGLSLFPDSMVMFHDNYLMLLTTTILMLLGGIGFITLHELFQYVNFYRKKKRFHISLHTRVVLISTFSLVIGSTIIFWLLERTGGLAFMSFDVSIVNAFFNAVSSRSTGFYTIPLVYLQSATLFMIMIIAFIGSSPGSTGSGIKNTTLAILIAAVKSVITHRNMVSIKGRSIAKDQVFKALSILILSISWIIVATFCLLITENNLLLGDILFETISAFATLGFSTGITPWLSTYGKLIIIATMIAGRIGVLGIILSLKRRNDSHEFSYPEERLMLG